MTLLITWEQIMAHQSVLILKKYIYSITKCIPSGTLETSPRWEPQTPVRKPTDHWHEPSRSSGPDISRTPTAGRSSCVACVQIPVSAVACVDLRCKSGCGNSEQHTQDKQPRLWPVLAGSIRMLALSGGDEGLESHSKSSCSI